MIKIYSGKISELTKSPSKVEYIPSFLKQEYFLWKGRKKSTVNGHTCTFVVNSVQEYHRVSSFMEEKEIIEEIMDEIDEETIFYDIGANVGTHSCFTGKAGAKVYSFEPFPKNARSLKKNFELNNIDGEIFEIALMNENSEMELAQESGEPGEGKVKVTENGDLKTQTYKGDDFIEEENLPKPDIVKIDVEGAELEVLKGLKDTLEGVSTLFIEIHSDNTSEFEGSRAKLENFLDETGFNLRNINQRKEEVHIKATNSAYP